MKPIYYLPILLFTTLFYGCKTKDIADIANNETVIFSNPKKLTLFKEITIKNVSQIQEASDLAYNDETQTLYIIGDKGDLYLYHVNNKNNSLYLDFQKSYKLTHKNKPFAIDSEGLTINDHNELILSFEGTPKITKLSNDGKIEKEYPLPQSLSAKENYTDGNKMLEAVAWHEVHGILTAAEFPLNNQNTTKQTIYALSGKVWHFKAEAYKNNAVTAIEVMDDNNLLILERAYKEGLIPTFYMTLKKLYLDQCDENRVCKTERLYSKKTDFKNYEGLTKIGNNHYLIVTDNQGKLTTDFLYFKVE